MYKLAGLHTLPAGINHILTPRTDCNDTEDFMYIAMIYPRYKQKKKEKNFMQFSTNICKLLSGME